MSASAAALIPHAISSRETGPKLTYTITRGNLIVTVNEQGTLESSENTEIKCKVRGAKIPIIWVIESGTEVNPGDELVRLETLEFEDRVNEVTKWAHATRAAAERSKAQVARAELAISEYLEGTYRSALMTLEKDLAVAESNLRTAQSMLDHADMMAGRGYMSELDVEESRFAVTQAELYLGVKKTEIDTLKNFSQAMELETLNGNLKAAKATHEANKARVKQLAEQLVLCEADLEYCVVKAERSGLVIYPTADPWERAPEIEKGATVYMGQTMLLMPDLSKMQVKLGIREAIVDRVRPGLSARVTLPDKTLDGRVSSVAAVAKPARWWTGNVVRYDTIIELPLVKGLRPGTSADIEVIVDRHENVLKIPVAAVLKTAAGHFCWVKTDKGAERRELQLGDTDNVFTVVQAGLQEGDEVLLNSVALMGEAQTEVLKPFEEAKLAKPKSPESGATSSSPESGSEEPANDSESQKETKGEAAA